MRLSRLVVLVVPVLAIAAAAAVFLRSGAEPAAGYRFDAIFDTAKGIIPGQLVKVAGARVGDVEAVELTPDYKARIKMRVDPRFGPFHTDARCSIQPEGLIAENFVQCEPGSTTAPELRGRGGEAPTVPVANTTVPINLTDLFNVFRTPMRKRFSVVVATLGIGTAARGEDINDILRRSNPTLGLVRRLTTILNRQRNQLTATVDATDRVVAELAGRRTRVQDFISHSASVAQSTADHRRSLGLAIRRLPPLLDEVKPLTDRLHEATRDTTPVLRDLRVAAPDVLRLVNQLEPASIEGRPALHSLKDVSVQGRETIRISRQTVALLRRLSGELPWTTETTVRLLKNLEERRIPENLVRFSYFAAAASSRFDSTAHMLPAHLFMNLPCSLPATTPVAGCNTFYRGGSSVLSPSRRPGSLELAGTRDAGDGERRRSREKRRGADTDELQPADDLAAEAVKGVTSKTSGAEELLGYLLK